MANYEATRYDFSGQDLTGVEGVNTGLIIPWGSASVPSGFLECNGAAVSEVTYAALFAVVGYTYGNPGSGNFNLPDLADRVAVHKSPTKVLATTSGANTVALQGSLQSLSAGNTTITTPTLGAHSHPWTSGMGRIGGDTNTNAGPDGGGMGQTIWTDGTAVTFTFSTVGGGGSHGHPFSGGTFTGVANSVLQPYLTLIYIIKT
jgi:microcystin-dependent protein